MNELDIRYIPNTYAQSEEDAQLPFWQKLYETFCGTTEIELEYFYIHEYPKMQAQGVDRRINFKDRKSLYMEEKFPEREYDRMFVEFYDDTHEDNLGWFHTINQRLCDYLVYGYRDTMKFYIIPYDLFKYKYDSLIIHEDYGNVTHKYDEVTHKYDEVIIHAYNGNITFKVSDDIREPGNITKGWLVPWQQIIDNVPGTRCIQLETI